MEDQSHPLEALDQEVVNRLLAATEPADADVADAARLLLRYQGFPGARSLQEDLERVLRLWQLDRSTLMARSRALWAAGFRPGGLGLEDAVGSSFDTSGDSTET